MATAAARAGFRRLFSVSAFAPPPPPAARAAAEPSNNLFVSGLNKRTTSEGLREAFSKFGQVIQARVVTDKMSGYSRGFGFVKYATVEEAAEGIKGMDGKFLDGWVIFAEYAKPREPPLPPQSPAPWTPPSGCNVVSTCIFAKDKLHGTSCQIIGSTTPKRSRCLLESCPCGQSTSWTTNNIALDSLEEVHLNWF